jgi:hypothetical protein
MYERERASLYERESASARESESESERASETLLGAAFIKGGPRGSPVTDVASPYGGGTNQGTDL